MAVLKYKNPADGSWIPIGVPGVTNHSQLQQLDIGDDHPQYLLKSGGEMSGALVVVEPVQPSHAASKQYVDNRTGAFVQPNDPGDPTGDVLGNRGALWVDTDEGIVGSDFLPLSGGTIQGDLAVAGSFAAPSAPSSVTGFRRITISNDPPPADVGEDGDIWFQRET